MDTAYEYKAFVFSVWTKGVYGTEANPLNGLFAEGWQPHREYPLVATNSHYAHVLCILRRAKGK